MVKQYIISLRAHAVKAYTANHTGLRQFSDFNYALEQNSIGKLQLEITSIITHNFMPVICNVGK